MRRILLSYIIVITFSCASIISVKVDYTYDPEVDFAALKSYDWLPVPSKSIKYPLIMKQIKSEMNRQLKVQGYRFETEEPDLLIAFHGGIQSMLQYEDWTYLHDNYEQYAIKRRIDMTKYAEDTLVFDFIGAKSKELIFRATANVYLSIEPAPEKREKRINEVITKVVLSFQQLPVTVSSK